LKDCGTACQWPRSQDFQIDQHNHPATEIPLRPYAMSSAHPRKCGAGPE
jgi:hypothetical protein